MAADRAPANQGVVKIPTPAKVLGKAPSRIASRQNEVRDQAFHSLKQKTARSHSVHWWLSHQRPVRVGLHCQTRYGLNLQLDNGGGSSHPYPLLDCLKRWQSDHTYHHPHRFNELATKSEKWNGKPRLECVNGRYPPSKTSVGVLPWTCQNGGKWSIRYTDGQSKPHKWLASRKIWSVEDLETLSEGIKPRTSHHRSPGGESRGKRKR